MAFYTSFFEDVGVAAIQDLFELVGPADISFKLISFVLGQTSDLKDAEEEAGRVRIGRASGSYTTGSGGSTPNESPHQFGSSAAGVNAKANNTTPAVAGTGALLFMQINVFYFRVGFLYQPTPEEMFIFSPSQACIINLPVAPADSVSMSGSITWEEIGG